MSAPVIVSVSPYNGERDVVLGRPVEILFNQPIDPASLSNQTFSLMGPGQTSLVDADELIRASGKVQTGREYITGAFGFPAPGAGDTWLQNQKAVFTPDRVLRPNVTYSVLVAGQSSLLSKVYVRNGAGEALANSYQFSFVTGELDLASTPVQSPAAPAFSWEKPALNPAEILVRPRKASGNNLSQEIELTFPGPIDPASFDPNDIIVAAEPFLNDPSIAIPNCTASVTVDGNKIRISVTWPA